MKKSYLFKYCLLLYVLLFSLIFARLFYFYRNQIKIKTSSPSLIGFTFFLPKHTTNCRYLSREGYYFQLRNCQTLSIGEYYTILGSPVLSSAKTNYYQIYIDVSSIKPYIVDKFSLQFIISCFYRYFYALSLSIARKITLVLKTYFSSSVSYLISGLTLGSGFTAFPDYFRQVVKRLGLSHMVAVSGFHLNVVYSLLTCLMPKGFPRRFSSLLICFCLLCYTFLVGAPLSLLRALLMLVFSLIGQNFFGKVVYSFHFLFISFVLLVLSDPTVLFNSGFQLSYLATLGILALSRLSPLWSSPKFRLVLSNAKFTCFFLSFRSSFKAAILVSLVAQLMSLPVLLNTFGELCFFGIFSTLLFSSLIVFLVSFTLPLLALYLVFQVLFPPFTLLLQPYFLFLNDFSFIFWHILTFCSNIVGEVFSPNFRFSTLGLLFYYLFLFLLYFCLRCFLNTRSHLVYV